MSESTQKSDSESLILIDGSSWLYRAFHALPPLHTDEGEPTGAVLGTANMLRRLMRSYSSRNMAVIFDPRGKTFRHEIYSDYKANRPPMPPELEPQFPRIRELIEALAVPLLQIEGVEADDVIGTLTKRAREQGRDVLIVTGDKDMAQLVDDHVAMLDTMKDRRSGPAEIEEKFGVPPTRIIDLLALMGDSSDNVPGVQKVGPKTAAKWINQYGSLDEVIENADDIGGKVGGYLRDALEQLPMSRDLVTIRCDLDLPLTVDELQVGEADNERLRELYRELGFQRLLSELEGAGTTAAGASAASNNAPSGSSGASFSDAASDPAADAGATPIETHYETIYSEAELGALIEKLSAADEFALDTETDSLDALQANLVGLSFATEPGVAWYLPVAHSYLGAPDQLSRDLVLERLKPLLESEDHLKVMQHGKYDANVLSRYDITLRGLRFDTMLESYVFNSTATRHDMDSLALKYLGRKTIKFSEVAGTGRKQVTFDAVDVDAATRYAAEDADVTLQLHRNLWPKLSATPTLKALFEDMEMPLAPVLARIEQNGVLIDSKALAVFSDEMAVSMRGLTDKAHDLAGGPFNLNSPAQLQQILFETLQLPVIRKTPKGQPSTAEDVLQELADEHELPRTILEWRSMSKLRSTYTERLPERVNPHSGRVHTSYHQAVAATGRLSSSEPNLQNIPVRTAEGRRIRQAFIAAPGCSLLSVDYSQIELRIMAHLSQDASLLEAFRDDRDVHRATAAEVFDVALDDVSSDQRRAAKAINFGLMYGMSAFGLARQLDIKRDEAQRWMDRFFERYPGVRAYMDRTREEAREQGYVETLFGRRLYLPDINARNGQHRQYAERTAINAPLQGTAADLIKRAMLDLDGWLSQQAPDIRMIMQVHDELVFEGPTASLTEKKPEIVQRMCAVAELDVPLRADGEIGDNWDESHG